MLIMNANIANVVPLTKLTEILFPLQTKTNFKTKG